MRRRATTIDMLVAEAWEALPQEVKGTLDGWAVEVQEHAPDHPATTMGLCIPALQLIVVYRRPHERVALTRAALRREVAETLLHEVAHALGLDEPQVRRLGPLRLPRNRT